MAKYGDFNISENEPELYLLIDNDILASLDLSFMAPVSVEGTEEVENALQISDMEGLPKPAGVPAPPPRDWNQWPRNSFKCLRTPDNQIPQNEILNGEWNSSKVYIWPI